ncbi:hypothetical protein [Archangium lipolyticum]|uniref:hypothetical protein n=1 Tax=Archangium lipolyticum TaxID=2970465 RepID=UPI00214A4CEC|nr:hypothetical protein [Archangium lipolyticum]
MAQWTQFVTPGGQIDFPEDPMKQQSLVQQWTTNLTGFTNQGITGNPWTSTNAANQNWYFNPVTTDTSQGIYAPIQWSPFPGRIQAYNPSMPMGQQFQLADTGYYVDSNNTRQTFPAITTNLCPNGDAPAQPIPYGPYGPRGWQDEYCEWSVLRDPSTGKILRIDFTCENPEYWNTLWMVDPLKVLELYQKTLDKPQIQMDDLCLHDSNGRVVMDPSTGRPAYNPLNKWNSGPFSTATQGGAMHLTSTPNTIQTEIGLAAAATIPRTVGNGNPTTLICCAQYGQIGRNSDPTIGASVNRLTAPQSGEPTMVTLANPPGLYIQQPDFSSYTTPDNTPASTFWRIVRGAPTLTDPNGTQLPGNFILHAVFEVPPSYGYTVSDISISGAPIKWAGQVAQTFQMHIIGMGIPKTPGQTAQPCVDSPATPAPQPLQLFHASVFNALYNTPVPNPVGQQMSLASNSTLIAPLVTVGQQKVPMVLVVGMDLSSPKPDVSFGDGITVEVQGMRSVTYAIPGNTYPSTSVAVDILVSVASTAISGLKGVTVTPSGQNASQFVAMPALLNVVGL